LERLVQALDRFTVAMLCAEKDPLACHRGLMIVPELVLRGIFPAHLRGGGSVETNADLEARLFAETGVGAGILDGLFAATVTTAERATLLVEAYREMARRKAYRLAAEDEPDDLGE